MCTERKMPAALLSRWGLKPVVVADDVNTSPASAEEDDPDDEVTGRILWDCTQVLWDLVADPDPQNVLTVQGKVCAPKSRQSRDCENLLFVVD